MAGSRFWGDLVLRLREEQNVSQRTLAALACVNRATLRRLEAGETSGGVDVLERLLNCLGYELEAMKTHLIAIEHARTRRPGKLLLKGPPLDPDRT